MPGSGSWSRGLLNGRGRGEGGIVFDGCADWVILVDVVVVIGMSTLEACGGLVSSVAAVAFKTSVLNMPV